MQRDTVTYSNRHLLQFARILFTSSPIVALPYLNMSPCFVSSMPLATARTSTFGTSVCASKQRSSPVVKRSTRGVVRMSEGDKNESIGDWLYRKMMHNALWEGDEQAGYEPFFVQAQIAREEELKKAYEEQERKAKQ